MKKTVNEIIEMIKNKQIIFDQSTQRQFLYADQKTNSSASEQIETTKAGEVIRSIVFRNIKLPAIYLWDTTPQLNDDKQKIYNLHDGKQRILSIYYFINEDIYKNDGHESILVVGNNNKKSNFSCLEQQDKDKLLNYKFDIVINSGSQQEEEESFFTINKSGLPLNDYECLRGMLFGKWFNEFEQYLIDKSKNSDLINCSHGIGRGEKALNFLKLFCFNDQDSWKKNENEQVSILKRDIGKYRNNHFDRNVNNFDACISKANKFYNELSYNKFSGKQNPFRDKKIITFLRIISHIQEKKYDLDKIINYYLDKLSGINDINKWNFETHIKAIDNLFSSPEIRNDGKRWFDDIVKDQLFKRYNKCVYHDNDNGYCEENRYNSLEVDHIKPWSKGGRTIIENAQLLCKNHNTKKGDEEIKF